MATLRFANCLLAVVIILFLLILTAMDMKKRKEFPEKDNDCEGLIWCYIVGAFTIGCLLF